jgi:hypothetical protein
MLITFMAHREVNELQRERSSGSVRKIGFLQLFEESDHPRSYAQQSAAFGTFA